MPLIIFGANGQVGRNVVRLATAQGRAYHGPTPGLSWTSPTRRAALDAGH